MPEELTAAEHAVNIVRELVELPLCDDLSLIELRTRARKVLDMAEGEDIRHNG